MINKMTLLMTVLDSMSEGVLVIDHRTREVLGYNSLFIKMWELDQEITKDTKYDLLFRNIVTKINDPHFFNDFISIATNFSGKKAFELLELKNNTFYEARTEKLVIDSNLMGQIFFFKDVTQERIANKNLLTQNALLETIITSIPYSVFWKDEKLNYLGCNERFALDAGLSAKELVGKNDYDMPWTKAEADFFRTCDKEIIDSGIGQSNFEETLKRGDGEDIVILTSKVPLKNESDEVIGILGIYTDITVFKNAQKRLQEQESRLVSASQLSALGEMAGGIAHEINNPLSIIKSSTKYLQKLMDKQKYSPDNVKEVLQEIDETVERIAKIIIGLKNISRSIDGEKDICCYKDILRDVLGVANERFKVNGIKLKDSLLDSELGVQFRANRIQISQVLINLFNNSFDALKEVLTDDKWIEIGIDYDSQWISFSVTDCGDGIPIHIRNKMFNPFYTTKEIGKGTGIGLSISKSMIENHGGKLLYDENSKFTRFVVTLPRGMDKVKAS